MNKRLKIPIFLLIAVVTSITAVYAVTIIRAADVTYDNSKSNGNSSNVQGAIDELYSMSDGSCSSGGSSSSTKNNLINYITNLAKTDTTNLAYDDTADKNLRYIGANPNNYVLFNDELWRIIGVMNNVKDADDNSASRVKLIRAESIGTYSWDNQGTNGINDWSKSLLKSTLNEGAYWNRTSGKCPNGANGSTTNCDFSNIGLTSESKEMITKVLWTLGGQPTSIFSASTFYISERSKMCTMVILKIGQDMLV